MSILVLFVCPAFIHSSCGDVVPPFSLEILLLLHYSQLLPLRWGGWPLLSSFCCPVTKTSLSEHPWTPAPPIPPATVTGSEMAPHSIRPTQLMPRLLLKGPGDGYSICCRIQAVKISPAALLDFTSPTKVCLIARSTWGNPANRWTWLQGYRLRLEIQLCLNYSTLKVNGVPHFVKGNFRVSWSLQLKGSKQRGRQAAYPQRKSTFLDAHPNLTRLGKCFWHHYMPHTVHIIF